MKKIILTAVLFALSIGAYLYYKRLVNGPEYALLQAVKAAKTHDVATFERYVDLQELTDELVAQMTEEGVTQHIPGANNPLMQGALRLMRPQLARAARQEIVRYIEGKSPQVGSRPSLPMQILGIAGAVVSPDSRFKGIKYSRRQGEEALMGLEFTQPRYDTTLVLEVQLKNQGDHWQVKQITNSGALVKQVARWEQHRLTH